MLLSMKSEREIGIQASAADILDIQCHAMEMGQASFSESWHIIGRGLVFEAVTRPLHQVERRPAPKAYPFRTVQCFAPHLLR